MRDREVIEKEIYRAREDLEESLAELKHIVAEKVDVKARARIAIEKGKQTAHDVLERGKARPALVAGIAGGIVAVGVLVYVGRKRDWW